MIVWIVAGRDQNKVEVGSGGFQDAMRLLRLVGLSPPEKVSCCHKDFLADAALTRRLQSGFASATVCSCCVTTSGLRS